MGCTNFCTQIHAHMHACTLSHMRLHQLLCVQCSRLNTHTHTRTHTQEEDLHEAFSEYGEIKNIYMNLDRQTGFVKGYALIEYKTKREAQAAIDAMNGAELLTQNVVVDYAFKVSCGSTCASGAD